MTHEEIQFEVLKTELTLTQAQMDKYDELSSKIKAWAVTLWIAALGWALQIERKEMMALALVMVAVFWALDAVNKNFREGYKRRRDEVARALRDLVARGGAGGTIPTPDLPTHRWGDSFARAFELHIVLLYAFLMVVTVLMLRFG